MYFNNVALLRITVEETTLWSCWKLLNFWFILQDTVSVKTEEKDIYDVILTQAEIQAEISVTNCKYKYIMC